MNYLDIAVAAALALGLILGYVRGLVSQLVSLAGLFLAVLAAYWFHKDVAGWLAVWFPVSELSFYEQYEFMIRGLDLDTYFYYGVAFALIFIGVRIGLNIVGRVLNLITKVPGLNLINRWLGALLGLVEAVILIAVAVLVMSVLPSDPVQELVADSRAAAILFDYIPEWASRLNELWREEQAPKDAQYI